MSYIYDEYDRLRDHADALERMLLRVFREHPGTAELADASALLSVQDANHAACIERCEQLELEVEQLRKELSREHPAAVAEAARRLGVIDTKTTAFRLGTRATAPRPDEEHEWLPLDWVDVDGERIVLWARWQDDTGQNPVVKERNTQ